MSYGITDIVLVLTQLPFGDIDDRIRAIAHGLGLQTVLWQYDADKGIFAEDLQQRIVEVDASYSRNFKAIILS